MVGLRVERTGSHIPLAEESQLFGVLIPITTDRPVGVMRKEGQEDSMTLVRGQYLVFLEAIRVQSALDCLVLYFKNRV